MENNKNERGFLKKILATQRSKGILTILLYIFALPLGTIVALFILLGAMFAVFISGADQGNASDFTGVLNSDALSDLMMLIIGVVSLIIFVVVFHKTLMVDIKRLTKKNIHFILASATITLIINFASAAVFNIFNIQFKSQEILSDLSASNALMPMFMVLFHAPITEEIVFRKAMSQIINNNVIFIVVSALLFGLTHEINIGAIHFFLMGVILAITYLKTDKNTTASMIVHFINNLVAFALAFISA